VFNNSNSADGSIYTSQCSGASEGPRIHFLLNFLTISRLQFGPKVPNGSGG